MLNIGKEQLFQSWKINIDFFHVSSFEILTFYFEKTSDIQESEDSSNMYNHALLP